MIITSHMQNIIQIHPFTQVIVTDGRTDRRMAAITISLTAIAGG